MGSLSDKISDGALCEYGNVLLIEDVKQKMDDIKEEIKVYTHPYDFRDIMVWKLSYEEIIDIIDKHLGDELK